MIVKESQYLELYGPGHFQFTFLCATDGFNELELNLLKHLIHNNRQLAYVCTKCDCGVIGIMDEAEEVTFVRHFLNITINPEIVTHFLERQNAKFDTKSSDARIEKSIQEEYRTKCFNTSQEKYFT